MQLETDRLILGSFREGDGDAMAELFANPDFMRFSLGVFIERRQTVVFIEKVTGWDRDGIPSQFAVVPRGEDAYHHAEVPGEIEIGYRLHPDYWNCGLITEAARVVRVFAIGNCRASSRLFTRRTCHRVSWRRRME